MYGVFGYHIFEFGFIGAVLPRSVIAAKGSEVFRKELFKSSTSLEIVSLENKGRWIFDMEPRYTILLTTISKGETFKEGIFVRSLFIDARIHKWLII